MNASDCSQFTSLLGWPPSGMSVLLSRGWIADAGLSCQRVVWAGIWILYSMLAFVAAIFAGIIVWKKTTDEMYEDA